MEVLKAALEETYCKQAEQAQQQQDYLRKLAEDFQMQQNQKSSAELDEVNRMKAELEKQRQEAAAKAAELEQTKAHLAHQYQEEKNAEYEQLAKQKEEQDAARLQEFEAWKASLQQDAQGAFQAELQKQKQQQEMEAAAKAKELERIEQHLQQQQEEQKRAAEARQEELNKMQEELARKAMEAESAKAAAKQKEDAEQWQHYLQQQASNDDRRYEMGAAFSKSVHGGKKQKALKTDELMYGGDEDGNVSVMTSPSFGDESTENLLNCKGPPGHKPSWTQDPSPGKISLDDVQMMLTDMESHVHEFAAAFPPLFSGNTQALPTPGVPPVARASATTTAIIPNDDDAVTISSAATRSSSRRNKGTYAAKKFHEEYGPSLF